MIWYAAFQFPPCDHVTLRFSTHSSHRHIGHIEKDYNFPQCAFNPIVCENVRKTLLVVSYVSPSDEKNSNQIVLYNFRASKTGCFHRRRRNLPVILPQRHKEGTKAAKASLGELSLKS